MSMQHTSMEMRMHALFYSATSRWCVLLVGACVHFFYDRKWMDDSYTFLHANG